KMEHTSKIYDGMKSDYWISVPAQYDPAKAAALMVWQDGQELIKRDGATRAQIVFDNLTHQKRIPVMIHVFISPGLTGTRRMRSIEYDTVNDQYARFLRMRFCRKSMRSTTSAKTARAAPSPATRQELSARSTWPGFSPISSAACCHASAASPASSGSP